MLPARTNPFSRTPGCGTCPTRGKYDGGGGGDGTDGGAGGVPPEQGTLLSPPLLLQCHRGRTCCWARVRGPGRGKGPPKTHPAGCKGTCVPPKSPRDRWDAVGESRGLRCSPRGSRNSGYGVCHGGVSLPGYGNGDRGGRTRGRGPQDAAVRCRGARCPPNGENGVGGSRHAAMGDTEGTRCPPKWGVIRQEVPAGGCRQGSAIPFPLWKGDAGSGGDGGKKGCCPPPGLGGRIGVCAGSSGADLTLAK